MDQTKNKGSVTLLLAVLYSAAFVAAFNENIINVALIDIMAQMGVDSVTSQWMVTGYMIVASVIVALMSFLSRRFPLRTLFPVAAGIFIVGTVGDILAPNYALLLAFRLMQAIGTGIFIPTMMGTVLVVAPRKKLGTYLSIGACCITLGPAFGPVVSGVMVAALGWRGVFVPPLVVMIVLLVLGLLWLQNVSQVQKISIDVASVILLAMGLTFVVFGLTQVTSNLVSALAALALGLASIGVFAKRQLGLEMPMMDVHPMANPRFALACLLAVISMMTTFSMSVLMPLYFQGSLMYSALVSGVLILIPIIFNAVAALLAGRIFDKRGEWPLLPVGFALIVIGQVLVFLLSPRMQVVPVVLAAAVVYAGVGLVMSPSQTAGLKNLDPRENAHGVSMMNTFIQMAGSLGPSLFVGILSTSAADAQALGSSAEVAQAAGFSSAVMVAAVIAAVGFAVSAYYAWSARSITAAPPVAAVSGRPASSALTVRSIMKDHAYSVSADATVLQAMDALVSHHTSGLPVVDGRERVVGFISNADIMKALGQQRSIAGDLGYVYLALQQESFDDRLMEMLNANVMEYATDRVVSADLSMSLEEVCTLLGERVIKKVPVLEEGRLVGTISRSDVIRALMESVSAAVAAAE